MQDRVGYKMEWKGYRMARPGKNIGAMASRIAEGAKAPRERKAGGVSIHNAAIQCSVEEAARKGQADDHPYNALLPSKPKHTKPSLILQDTTRQTEMQQQLSCSMHLCLTVTAWANANGRSQGQS
eukprot:scaffold259907_cov21-Tisochrysis_lutea.AAC.1